MNSDEENGVFFLFFYLFLFLVVLGLKAVASRFDTFLEEFSIMWLINHSLDPQKLK